MLLAIGLIAMPSAMAAEFGVSLDMTNDISTDGGLQVAHPGTALALTVRFDRAVVLAASNITVSGFDEDGVYIPSVALASTSPITPTTAAREITLNITVTEATYKVILKIAKGIASDDPFNDDTSAELKQEIKLLAADAGEPEVISIRRVSDPLLPLGKDDTSVQVVITLSELPKDFTKDHVSASNATHGDPVALDPVVEDPNRYRQLITAVEEAVGPVDPVPELRGLYDGFNRAGTAVTDLTGIHAAINR